MASKKKDYFANIVSDGTAAKRLIESIHHYKVKGANIIRLALNANATNTTAANSIDATDVIKFCVKDGEDDSTNNKGEKKRNTNTFASKSVAEIVKVDDIPVPTPNIYFSLNDFFGLRRLSASCCALNGFFIDIDGHSIDFEELPKELKKLEKLLNKKFDNGTILVPTFITKTGRGYGLFYVLQNSISCRGNTDRMIALYDLEYKTLLRAFADVIKDTPFDVDTKVVDRSRVVRMPDTYNYKAGTFCRLFDYEGRYYSMGEIMDGCHLDRYIKHDYTIKKAHADANKKKTKKYRGKLPKALNRANIANFDDFKTKQMLLKRVIFIENLVKWKTECGKTLGYREEACFQYYNALVQLIDRAEAKKKTRELNASFLNPLPEKRLVCAFSPDNFRDDKRGLYGYYPFTNAKIIALFRNKDEELTYQKAAELGLFLNSREMERAEKKKETAEKRKIREQIVEKIKRDNPDRYDKDLVEVVNMELMLRGIEEISSSTLRRIIKKLGLGRPGSLKYEDTAEYKAEQARKAEVQARKVEKMAKKTACEEELPKSAQEYCSVPFEKTAAKPFCETLDNIQAVCPVLNDVMVSAIIGAYDDLSDKNKNLVDAGMEYVFGCAQENGQFGILIYDIDNLFKSMQRNRVRITYLGVPMPMDVIQKRKEWIGKPVPRDLEVIMEIQKKQHNQKTSLSAETYKRLTLEENHMILCEKLYEIAKETDTLVDYKSIKSLRKDHPIEIHNLFEVLGRRRKTQIVKFFNTFNKLSADKEAYLTLKMTVQTVLGEELSSLHYVKPERSEKQKAAWKFWQDLKNVAKNSTDSALKHVCKVYKRLNWRCKNNLPKKYMNSVTGNIYSVNYLKKTILNQTTMDLLRLISREENAERMNEETLLNKLIQFCSDNNTIAA